METVNEFRTVPYARSTTNPRRKNERQSGFFVPKFAEINTVFPPVGWFKRQGPVTDHDESVGLAGIKRLPGIKFEFFR